MKQSSFIFGAILIAFLIYITIRNQLPDYIALFTAAKIEPISPPAKPNEKSNPYTQSLETVINEVFSNAGLI